jgi:ABC-2 type transport system ATP-binding protein
LCECPALRAENLVKMYYGGRNARPVRALDGLSLAVSPGSIAALLGPNGAGKSTTVKILTTLARPDSGAAAVAGIDVLTAADRVRSAIGLVSQKASSDPMATGGENLVLAGRIHGMSRRDAAARAAALLDRFGLTDAANRLARTYSGGMARKLDVAIGLIHRPQVLFLDEPTTGLDPEARAEMWAEIARLAGDERVTVLLTTHYLEEADQLAARVAIVDHGRVVVEGTPEELKSELRGDTVQVEVASAATVAAAQAALERTGLVRDVVADGAALRARADSGARAVPSVLAALEAAGVAVASVTVARPSLDDVYLRYAGRSLVGAPA